MADAGPAQHDAHDATEVALSAGVALSAEDAGGVGTDALAERWEHGSMFDLSMETGVSSLPWDALPHRWWGSGRDALRGLLEWGHATQGWRRLQVPSYYCQHTLARVIGIMPTRAYPWEPTDPRSTSVEAAPGDVVLAVHAFGLPPQLEIDPSAVVIEDHTHGPDSPLARASRSHYAVASLRKAYPLPDGGVLWSPRRLPMPSEPAVSPEHAAMVLERLSAMTLKRLYLTGAQIEPSAFRASFARTEDAIGSGPASGISAFSRLRLPTLPTTRWDEQRARNLGALREALGRPSGVRLLAAPFAAVLVFDDPSVRDRVRGALLHERVFPAVLWPLRKAVVKGIPRQHVSLSDRILVVHADQRYVVADMQRVAAVLQRALDR